MYFQDSLFNQYNRLVLKPAFVGFPSLKEVLTSFTAGFSGGLVDKIPYKVSQKLIISGSFVEHYEFEKSYWVGYPRFVRKRNAWGQDLAKRLLPVQDSIRGDNVGRTRTKVRRLVNCNQELNRFMTMTWNEPIFDLSKSNPEFRKFIKRMNRLYPKFKYLAVPEFQPTSKRVHYHLLCNLPFLDENTLTKIWGHGFCFLRKIDDVDNMGAYICKYLGKANFDSRYFKKNKFFYSYNLLRPVVVDKLNEVLKILKNLPVGISCLCQNIYKSEFLTEFLGVIQYKQYKLATFIKVGS